MLSIKEIFDICKEHDVYIDLSYLNTYYDAYCYMIKLYYGSKRHYALFDRSFFDGSSKSIFDDRDSFEKYICDALKEAKEKEDKE